MHCLLGMSSKNDPEIIDDRQTYQHVTTEKLKEVVELIKLQTRQHVLLGHEAKQKKLKLLPHTVC